MAIEKQYLELFKASLVLMENLKKLLVWCTILGSEENIFLNNEVIKIDGGY